MSVSAKEFNEAVCAYIEVLSPNHRALTEHIATHDLQSSSEAIISEIDSLLSAVQLFLLKYPGGVPWTAKFKREFYSHFLQLYPWLATEGFEKIVGYSHLFCTDVGLNTPAHAARIFPWA